MEKPEIRPPSIRKRLNGWLPQLVGETTSRISTPVQNCISIRLGDFAPHICEVAYQMFTRLVFFFGGGLLPTRYRLGRSADFDDQYAKRRLFAQGCAFVGPENKFLHFDPIFAQKTQIFGRFSTRLKISAQNGL